MDISSVCQSKNERPAGDDTNPPFHGSVDSARFQNQATVSTDTIPGVQVLDDVGLLILAIFAFKSYGKVWWK